MNDVCQEHNAPVEGVVSAKIGELEECLSKLLSGCAKEACVRDEADALKALLSGVELRFREEHAVLVGAINALSAAANAQTSLLGALYRDVKAMSEKVDVICSRTDRLGHVEGDVAAIADTVQAMEKKTDAVSSDVSRLQGQVDDIRLVVEHKADTVGKAEEASRPPFSGKDLEVMAKGVEALKQWTGKTSATIVYDSRVDPFTDQGLFDKVQGKKNVAVVGFTTDGDVFGGFYSVAVTKQKSYFRDPNIFAFSFESHGRCDTPQRFVVNEWLKENVFVEFYKDFMFGFVFFGVNLSLGGFFLGNEMSESYCSNLSDAFEGLENTTLTGKNSNVYDQLHHCTRIVAFQLE